ncbi:hypothetical protein EZ428_09680 [Pedobacter frigiditerrae]|uniref:Uncharacterized protein n=1 Tax=Pedobacter frigiditerrae TaxID=2530452 RepID=A0A4R0MYI6_9SPHI|nr:hypothetical protein [Pedobacter frigiditerrae]TCC91997.1 hypothetical protein EZ428_09680 [Pedobacter frigiditerrae]
MNFLKILFPKMFQIKLETNFNSGKSYDEVYKDLGVFKYDIDGFSINYANLSKAVKWSEISALNVYKKDELGVDCITMEIVYDEKYFSIDEETPGWYQFVIKTKEVFPSIPKDWDMEIIQPPFATNYRIIYTKP